MDPGGCFGAVCSWSSEDWRSHSSSRGSNMLTPAEPHGPRFPGALTWAVRAGRGGEPGTSPSIKLLRGSQGGARLVFLPVGPGSWHRGVRGSRPEKGASVGQRPRCRPPAWNDVALARLAPGPAPAGPVSLPLWPHGNSELVSANLTISLGHRAYARQRGKLRQSHAPRTGSREGAAGVAALTRGRAGGRGLLLSGGRRCH